MSITSYSTTYFDDFNVKDVNQGNKTVAEKNYLRILFKPGYSVQVREVNQLQSILQSQIDRLGSSIYKDGSAILGGNCTFDNNVSAVDISTGTINATSLFTTLANTINVSSGSSQTGVTAKLLGYKIISTNILRLYVRYNNSIQDSYSNNVNTFLGLNVYSDAVLLGACNALSYAAGAFLSEGIFYTKGSFVWTPAQAVFLDKVAVDTLVNQLIVIGITESVVNYSNDGTILDNATGMPNYSAPGADRYTIDLSLDFVEMDPVKELPVSTTLSPSNYIKLLTIKNSQCLETVKQLYTSLDDVLAKRTYEESGDYTLSPFKITLREFYNDGVTGGRYTVDEMPTGSYPATIPVQTDIQKEAIGETLYSISLDPAVAYIKGYRVELTQNRDLYSTKSRANVLTGASVHSSARVGNYIVGKFNHGSTLPVITNPTTAYNIYDEPESYYSDGNILGTCKIRAVDGTADAIRLHLFDIKMNSEKYLSNAKRIYSVGSVDFDISGVVTLIDSQNSTSLFPIPYGTTKAVSNVSYTYDKLFTGTWNSGPNTTTFTTSVGLFGDTSSIICTDYTSGLVKVISGTGSASTTVTLPGRIVSAILPIIIDAGSSPRKTKTINTITTSAQEVLSAGTAIRMLSKGDVIKINSVYTTSGISGKNVTSMCSITDDGQRDNYYTNASITYTGATSDTLYISYDYFDHGTGDYFSVSSYTLSDTFLYDNIPSYKGVRLSDVYDFRPLILFNPASPSSIVSFESFAPLDPDSIITSTIDYYLPKIDTVIVDSNGIFSVLQGDPALEPKASSIPANAIALYTLDVPAYTYSPKDITVNYIDNRRFTMRDIGGIEQRISNIEYYTSLSLLETSAQNASITDNNGQRLKNGYIVDAFTGHSIGDPANSGYACSMDNTVGLLRPMFTMKNLRLVPSDTSAVKLHDHTITLPYTEQVLINQSYGSDTLSVNPYDVAVFSGNISLIPSSDNWKDTIHAPDLVINNSGAYDAVALTAATSDTFGFHWNEWQTNWLGQSTVSGRSAITAATGFSGASINKAISATTTTAYQSRSGSLTSLGYTDQTQSLGNKAIDISYIPYIRPIKIYFNATKLKPNTRVFAFFDGINVTGYCNQLTNIPTSMNTAGDSAVYYDIIPSIDVDILKGLPIITDEFGNVQGEFYIPNNKLTKFKCGQRVFKLSDSPSNTEPESTTVADTQYIASGTTETQQDTILSIRKPELVVASVSQNQAINVGTSIQWNDPIAQTFMIPNVEEGLFATGFDLYFSAKSTNLPVTAYIVICSNGIPTQQIMPFSTVTMQAADINVDANSGTIATNFKFSDPVYLLNGTEYAIVVTSNSADYRIWLATVGGIDVSSNTSITKNAYNGVLLMSQNASTWTSEQTKDMKFKMYYAEFDTSSAVAHFTQHLSGGIVSVDISPALSDTYTGNNPAVTIAPPGLIATASVIIPSSGVIPNTVTISADGNTGYILPPLVTIISTSGGAHAKAHALINAGKVTSIIINDGGVGYSTATTTIKIDPPGVTATAISIKNPNTNKLSGISITNPGSGYSSAPVVKIAKSSNPSDYWTTTGTVESVDISLFNLNRNAVAVNNTSITDSLDMNIASYSTIIPNENYAAVSQFSIDSTSAPIDLKSTLSSTSSYLSPVIDIERNSLICVNNVITDGSGTDTELIMDAGNAAARYITRTITLNNASDQIDIYVNVNRPITNSNIRVYVKYNDDTNWNLYNSIPGQIPVSSDPSVFTEIHYTDNIHTVPLFTSFAVKIVMVSDDKTQVPTIKDFRAIATF